MILVPRGRNKNKNTQTVLFWTKQAERVMLMVWSSFWCVFTLNLSQSLPFCRCLFGPLVVLPLDDEARGHHRQQTPTRRNQSLSSPPRCCCRQQQPQQVLFLVKSSTPPPNKSSIPCTYKQEPLHMESACAKNFTQTRFLFVFCDFSHHIRRCGN